MYCNVLIGVNILCVHTSIFALRQEIFKHKIPYQNHNASILHLGICEDVEDVSDVWLQHIDIAEKKKKLGKNPDVDTSFLPDRDREVSFACVYLIFVTSSMNFCVNWSDLRVFYLFANF